MLKFLSLGIFTTTLLLLMPLPSLAGNLTLPDGSKCEGEITNGSLNGQASCQFANGDRLWRGRLVGFIGVVVSVGTMKA